MISVVTELHFSQGVRSRYQIVIDQIVRVDEKNGASRSGRTVSRSCEIRQRIDKQAIKYCRVGRLDELWLQYLETFANHYYGGAMSLERVPGGVVHILPQDLRRALLANSEALSRWIDITPLARNEFICWVEDAKQLKTRDRRIQRTQEELQDGMRRPCCWPGCKHRERTGKAS